MLRQEDIIQVGITSEMINEAKLDTEFLKSKIGKNTRAAYENRDLIGSLAHQIVEEQFEFTGFPYTSYRTTKFKKGDECDIAYEHDFLDIKGTHGIFNERYFYNQQFLVFTQQLEDEKIELLTHFVFVMIHPNLSCGWIFGEIPVSEFLRKSEPVKIQYDNRGIKAKELYGFRNYIYRTGAR